MEKCDNFGKLHFLKKVIEISHMDRRACVRSIYGLGQDKERGPREEGWEVKKECKGGGGRARNSVLGKSRNLFVNSNKSRDTAGFINGFFIIYMRVPKNGKK